MAKNFAAQVDEHITKYEKRLNALARQSTNDLVNIIQTPVAKGGKMRVDTGFMRASGQMSLTGVPQGPVRGDPDKTYESAGEETVLASLSAFQLGMSIFFGWTANYSRIRETYDGFLEAGLQRWQEIVDKNVSEIKRRIK